MTDRALQPTIATQLTAHILNHHPRPLSESELNTAFSSPAISADLSEALKELVDNGTLIKKTLQFGPDNELTLFRYNEKRPTIIDDTPPSQPTQEGPDPELTLLRDQVETLRAEQTQLLSTFDSDFDVDTYVDAHIKRLHHYNEIKDVGQMIIGKCAEQEGTTTREMYTTFGLEEDD
ncbi:swi5-like zinc finger protein [Rhizophlyctis rosea]|uniref:Swi5-like zinc finger protein n=1 Tax=Rhizophlyctis rosea TaxID=64517 RepID=A0AAD5X5F8_9FUNG|nr:swi5-like zinc finger protein [Rhizophlyctis rosea]